MKKRDLNTDDKELSKLEKESRFPSLEHHACDEDFLSFDSVNSAKFDATKKMLAAKLSEETKEDLESQIATKFDRESEYPWLSDETMKIRDVYLFLHNEILDFV